MRTRRGQEGFTLAELLVASVLLSLVMASVYTMFYAVLVPWRSVERDYDSYRGSRNAMTLLEREVNNLTPGASHLFEGKDDEVTMFVVTEPMEVEESEGRHLMRVRYRFDKANGEIEREEGVVTTPLPLPPQDPTKEIDKTRVKVKKGEKFVVATNVADFSVRYVWLPQPKQRDPKTPPTPIVPVYAKMHKQKWGYPQGIEFTLKMRAPEKKDAFQTVTKLVPLSVPNGMRSMDELTKQLGSALTR